MHEILDFFSLLVALLALIALFVDPSGTRRALFLKIGLATSFVILVAYGAYEHWNARRAEAKNDDEVSNKEVLVVNLICREGEMNFEQLYNETSQGFSDDILNQAIDDLTQKRKNLITRWIEVALPTLPAEKRLIVRLYNVTPGACPPSLSRHP
jgi:hypothetical protein